MAFVRITCTGTSFSPAISLRSGSTATASWTIEGGGTTTGLTPTITLPGGTSYVDLNVSTLGIDTFEDVTVFNIGYSDSDDVGNYMIGPSYNHIAQSVTALQNITLMTNLQIFCASRTPLTGSVDFSNMSALQHIECYQAHLTGVNLTGCSAIVRICFEQNNLTALDLNPVAGSVYDIRAAAQAGGVLTFTPLTAPLAHAYHLCVRDQMVYNPPTASQLPAIQQQWTWNTNQSGQLVPATTAMGSLIAYNNWYSSANLTNIFTGTWQSLDLHNNNLASITLTGCAGLSFIDLHNNCLSTDSIDAIIATVDSWNTDWGVGNGTLNLSGNRPPSAASQTHIANLTSRHWTVTTETLSSAARPNGVFGDAFDRADCTGVPSVGNGWFALDSATANISNNRLIRTDAGAFRRLLNTGSGLLPPDYTVVARIPGATLGSYFGLMGRWWHGDGVQVFFAGGPTVGNLYVCSASGFLVRILPLTTLASFPASWSNTSIDHTFALQLSGPTATVILDGTAVVSATIPNNATVWGTGYGICGEGQNRAWYSIGAFPTSGSAPVAIL